MKSSPRIRLGLTAKTIGVTTLVVLVVASAFIYVAHSFERLRHALDDLTTHQVEQLMTAVRLTQRTETLALLGMMLSQASSQAERRETLVELNGHLNWVLRNSGDLAVADADPGAVAQVQATQQNLANNVRQLNERVRDRIDGATGADNLAQIRRLTQANREMTHELSVLVGYFSAASRGQISEVSAQLSAQAERQQRLFMAQAALLVLTMVLSGLYVQRGLVQRILRLQRTLDMETVDPARLQDPGHDELARLSLTVGAYVRRIQQHEAQMRRSNEELAYLSEHDPLTQLANRRHFEAAAGHLLRQGELPLCIAIGDIDFFKAVNDVHGHAQGDAVLVHVARRMERGLRSRDVLARLGGEEFGVVLPVRSAHEAGDILERIRQHIAVPPYVTPQGVTLALSISFGCVMVEGPSLSQLDATDQAPLLLATALDAADRALYTAKREGRDRICYAPASLHTQGLSPSASHDV